MNVNGTPLSETTDIATNVEDVTTSLGTDGSETPPNGTGVRGWLRAIYDKLVSGLTIDGTVEVTNDIGNPLPVSGSVMAAVSGTVTVGNTVNTNSIVAGTVAVSNQPSDFPDSGTHTQLATLHADNGTDGSGITQPTGGVGIRGWLSGIYNKLSGSLAVTGTFWQALQPVSVSSSVLPPGAATADNQVATIPFTASFAIAGLAPHIFPVDSLGLSSLEVYFSAMTGSWVVQESPDGVNDWQTVAVAPSPSSTNVYNFSTGTVLTAGQSYVAQLSARHAQIITASGTGTGQLSFMPARNFTNGNGLTKITDGTNTLALQTGDEFAIPSYPQTKTVTQTVASVAATGAIDTLGYSWVSLTTTASTTLSFTPQTSVDSTFTVPKNVTWYDSNIVGVPVNGIAAPGATTSSIIIPLTQRWLRCNVTVFSGASNTFTYVLHSGPIPAPGLIAVSGTVTISGQTIAQGAGIGSSATAWAVSGVISSTSNNANTSAVTGGTINLTTAQSFWGMMVIVAGTGSLTALTVVLEGSLDGGTNWKTIATFTGTTTDYISNTNPMPFTSIRSRITTMTVASLVPTVTTKISGTI